MIQVSLEQILQAREDRVRLQQQLLQDYNRPIICFTMNIAGPVKTSGLIKRGFDAGLQALDRTLAGAKVLERQVYLADTGDTALFAVDMGKAELKEICVQIEEATPLGRLFDIDVLGADGIKLERQGQRGCIVCGKPGRACAAGRLHSVEALQDATNRILREHFSAADRETIGNLAVQSLIDEVNITPKPGLVDRRNAGSHTDMDINTFLASAHALKPYFAQCVEIGQSTANEPPHITFNQLRQAGLAAEKAMFAATGGVNTHKGAIFTLGILCGSIGRLWTPETPVVPIEELLAQCARMGKCAEEDFATGETDTAGKRLYRQRGLRGIRGEVADGLPSVSNIALPVLTEGLEKGLPSNDAAACALLQLIAQVEDSNLYHRGGEAGAAYAKQAAQELLKKSPWPTLAQIAILDDSFIARRLSPGGCADLLAVTCFLHHLQSIK